MLIAIKNLLRKHLFSHPRRYLLVPLSLVIILLLCFSLPAMAEEAAAPANTADFKPVDLKGLTIADIERLFPMSPEAEAAIVHPAPLCPIIIDGVRYEGSQISLFNGTRLRYINGSDGELYAFTTIEGFMEFQSQLTLEELWQDVEISTFYLNTWYGGSSIGVSTGDWRWALDPIFDDAISSLKVAVDASWAYLFDYSHFTGDWYGFPRGSSYPNLANQGWNDRASSIWVAE